MLLRHKFLHKNAIPGTALPELAAFRIQSLRQRDMLRITIHHSKF
ncbi:MAG: hypothetical protein ABIR84_13130 [Candidatus Nitrotoga sp.]